MTGLIQKLGDNTVAYVGDNGIAVKSKDGKEMFVDTSGLSYDIVMDMFRNLPRNGNFFSNKYWSDNIQKAHFKTTYKNLSTSLTLQPSLVKASTD